LPAYHQKLGKARKDLSITLKGIWPCQSLDFRLPAFGNMWDNFCCFVPLMVHFYSSPQKWMCCVMTEILELSDKNFKVTMAKCFNYKHAWNKQKTWFYQKFSNSKEL
jgi:hypothetical protein